MVNLVNDVNVRTLSTLFILTFSDDIQKGNGAEPPGFYSIPQYFSVKHLFCSSNGSTNKNINGFAITKHIVIEVFRAISIIPKIYPKVIFEKINPKKKSHYLQKSPRSWDKSQVWQPWFDCNSKESVKGSKKAGAINRMG